MADHLKGTKWNPEPLSRSERISYCSCTDKRTDDEKDKPFYHHQIGCAVYGHEKADHP